MSKRTYDEALSSVEVFEQDLDDSPKVLKDESNIKKYSLDSDEEDDGRDENYDILAHDDIEGQEEGSSTQEGAIRVTPFNMREELEEGHFDTEGNYYWKNEKEVRDSWLDNIEWVNIRNKKTGQEGEETSAADLEEEVAPESPFDQIASYTKMLEFMKPKESVAKTLQRLGGSNNLSASERLRRKKAGLDLGNPGDKQAVTDLTELANNILSRTGNMDIYQETYEYIKNEIERSGAKENKSKVPTLKAVEPELDMYADDFNEKAKSQKARKDSEKAAEASALETKKEDMGYEKEPVVTWLFKWKKDAKEIHGPHTSEQMQAWLDDGYFKGDEWVCRVRNEGEGEFFSIKRVDFEIYL